MLGSRIILRVSNRRLPFKGNDCSADGRPLALVDWTQSLMWGLSAGLNTPITLFYPAFFLAVLTHRCSRDFERCAMKYGDE